MRTMPDYAHYASAAAAAALLVRTKEVVVVVVVGDLKARKKKAHCSNGHDLIE